MRPTDLLILPVAALWQQKLRTILTTSGVVFGAFVLAASLSIGEGVQETLARESRRHEVSRRIDVFPKWSVPEAKAAPREIKVEGDLGESRRERLRKALSETDRRANANMALSSLTRERMAGLAAIPHVSRVIPQVYDYGFAILGPRSEPAEVRSARPDDEGCRRRIVAGRFFDAPDERAIVVSEFLAYRLGLVDDAGIDGLVGKPLRLEFRPRRVEPGTRLLLVGSNLGESREQRSALDKLTARLPGSLDKLGLDGPEVEALRKALGEAKVPVEPEPFREEFIVVGVTRAATEEDRAGPWDSAPASTDVLLPDGAAMDLYFRARAGEEPGLNQAMLIVDRDEDVKDVLKQVLGLGVEARAAIEYIERERMIYLMIFGGMTCVAGVALLVSALGIANTMLMSVLERKREIGIMKAVGADARHLQFLFVAEGGLIGLAGAAIGLLLAWAASFPADAWVHGMVLRDIKVDLKGSIFVFPPWIGAAVLLFTVLVTTVAAFYPARRAASVDPVSALRHE